MSSVVILAHPARPEATQLAEQTAAWLRGEGHHCRLLVIAGPELVNEDGHIIEMGALDLRGADLAISLGGDGTFLRLMNLAYAADIPIVGVNFGRLGYLLEVDPKELETALRLAFDGGLRLVARMAIAVSVDGSLQITDPTDRSLQAPGGGPQGRWWLALNEMVAEKTVPGHMVRLATAIDGEEFLTYAADGVLVATPTGSTAYNLSAGGPVLAPEHEGLILTPVAPHLSIDRSVVLGPEQTVTVTVLEERPAVLVIDGREVGRLSPGAAISCQRAHRPVQFLTLGGRGFAGRLRSTLMLDRER